MDLSHHTEAVSTAGGLQLPAQGTAGAAVLVFAPLPFLCRNVHHSLLLTVMDGHMENDLADYQDCL